MKGQVEFSLHECNFTSSGQHLEVPSVTSGGSRRRECLKPAKKRALRRPKRCAAPVQPCLSLPEPPPPGGETGTVFPALSTRHRHLAGRVPRAKRLGRQRRNPRITQRRGIKNPRKLRLPGIFCFNDRRWIWWWCAVRCGIWCRRDFPIRPAFRL